MKQSVPTAGALVRLGPIFGQPKESKCAETDTVSVLSWGPKSRLMLVHERALSTHHHGKRFVQGLLRLAAHLQLQPDTTVFPRNAR
jgi:hypothetical protein